MPSLQVPTGLSDAIWIWDSLSARTPQGIPPQSLALWLNCFAGTIWKFCGGTVALVFRQDQFDFLLQVLQLGLPLIPLCPVVEATKLPLTGNMQIIQALIVVLLKTQPGLPSE